MVYLYLTFSPLSRRVCYTMLVVGFRKKSPLSNVCACMIVCGDAAEPRAANSSLYLCLFLSLLMRQCATSQHGTDVCKDNSAEQRG